MTDTHNTKICRNAAAILENKTDPTFRAQIMVGKIVYNQIVSIQ